MAEVEKEKEADGQTFRARGRHTSSPSQCILINIKPYIQYILLCQSIYQSALYSLYSYNKRLLTHSTTIYTIYIYIYIYNHLLQHTRKYNNWRPIHTIEHTLEEMKQLFQKTSSEDQTGFSTIIAPKN